MLRIIRAIEWLNVVTGVLSGLAILAITLIVTLDVAMRAFLHAPLRGATELSTLLLIGLVYLGLASVQVSRANFRVEGIVSALPPRWRRWQEFLAALIAAIAITIFAWRTGAEALRSVQQGEMSFGAIVFPVWPARITITVGLSLLALQLYCDCLRLLLNLERPQSDAPGEGALH